MLYCVSVDIHLSKKRMRFDCYYILSWKEVLIFPDIMYCVSQSYLLLLRAPVRTSRLQENTDSDCHGWPTFVSE